MLFILLRQVYIRQYSRLFSTICREKLILCTCNILQLQGQDFRRPVVFYKQAQLFKQTLQIQCRQKSKRSSKDSKDDTDSDEDEEEDDNNEDDFEDVPGVDGYKHKKMHSLRCDNIVARALSFSNSEVLKIFYGSKLLLDGQILLKKSRKIKEGNTIEVILKDGESNRTVRRIEIIKVSDKLTKKGNPIVYVRVWRKRFELEAS